MWSEFPTRGWCSRGPETPRVIRCLRTNAAFSRELRRGREHRDRAREGPSLVSASRPPERGGGVDSASREGGMGIGRGFLEKVP